MAETLRGIGKAGSISSEPFVRTAPAIAVKRGFSRSTTGATESQTMRWAFTRSDE